MEKARALARWLRDRPRKAREAWRKARPGARAAGVGIAFVVALGMYGLGAAVGIWAAVALLVVALVVRVRLVTDAAGRMLGAFLAAAIALIGFNVLIDFMLRRVGWGLPIVVGLGVAVVVFGAAATVYLWSEKKWPAAARIAAGIVLAVVVIIGIPWFVGSQAEKPRSVGVEGSDKVASRVDVLIVTTGKRHPVPADVPADAALQSFDVRYSVGVADAGRVRWTLIGAKNARDALQAGSVGAAASGVDGTPAVDGRTDSVLVLLVDGTAPVTDDPDELEPVEPRTGEVARWRKIARSAMQPGMPVYALLQTRRQERVDDWDGFVTGGSAVSIQALASRTVSDAAVRLAVAAPSSRGDLLLAAQYRPALLFDSQEPVPRPLSVDALFKEGHVRVCHDDDSAGCPDKPVTEPQALENGGTHLRLELPGSNDLRRIAYAERDRAREELVRMTAIADAPAPPPGTPPAADAAEKPLGAGSAIYVHPHPVDDPKGRRLLYLDYWWYLPDNPARTGAGAFCGAGLVISGITCHNHQSDWEGMTVVVDRTAEEPVVVALQYAQHNHVVRYDWQTLQNYWRKYEKPILDRIADPATRPLAFIAKGTHATYPTPCINCKQEAVAALVTFGENRHDGQLEWSGNSTSTCGGKACLQPLPTRDRGRLPALWNDFEGPWGERNCKFEYFCDSGAPPAAPGRQRRYADPVLTTSIHRADGP